MGKYSSQKIDDAVAAWKKKPEILHLNQLRLQSADIARLAAEAAFRLITQLNLRGNNIGPTGAEQLAKHLRRVPQLTTLDLDNNNIGPAGAEQLAKHLRRVPQLTTLQLGNNNIGPTRAEQLAKHLRRIPQLATLNFAGNDIGSAGAEQLAKCLRRVPKLTTLDLSSNGIGDAGAEQLAKHLRRVPELTTLNLYGNNIGPAGAEQLAKHLRRVPELTKLDVSANNIGDAAAAPILESIKSIAPCMRDIRLRACGITQAGWIVKWLQRVLSPLHVDDGRRASFRIDLDRNPIEGIDAGLLRASDPETFLANLRDSLGGARLLENKIAVLGCGGIGKSDLCDFLISGGTKVGNGESTHDFRIIPLITPLDVTDKNGKRTKMAATVFDFGGQEELYSNHRFFIQPPRSIRSKALTLKGDDEDEIDGGSAVPRSTFVLVLRGDKPLNYRSPNPDDRQDPGNRGDYWLEYLRHFARHDSGWSPIVVVIARCDQRNSPKTAGDGIHSGYLTGAVMRSQMEALGFDLQRVRIVDDFSAHWPGRQKKQDSCERLLAALREAAEMNEFIFSTRYPKGFMAVRQWLAGKGDGAIFADGEPLLPPLWTAIGYNRFLNAVRAACWHGQRGSNEDAPRLTEEHLSSLADTWLNVLRDLGEVHSARGIAAAQAGSAGYTIFHVQYVKTPVYALLRWDQAPDGVGLADFKRIERYLTQWRNDPSLRSGTAVDGNDLWLKSVFGGKELQELLDLMTACEVLFKDPQGDLYFIPERMPAQFSGEPKAALSEMAEAHFDFLPPQVMLRFTGISYFRRLSPKNISRTASLLKFSELDPPAEAVVRGDEVRRTITVELYGGDEVTRAKALGEIEGDINHAARPFLGRGEQITLVSTRKGNAEKSDKTISRTGMNSFRREPDGWRFVFRGCELPLFPRKELRGLNDIARLLDQPGVPISVIDLRAGDDEQRRAEDKAKTEIPSATPEALRRTSDALDDLRGELDEERNPEKREELERLIKTYNEKWMRADLGPTGRPKNIGPRKAAQTTVNGRIKTALKAIEKAEFTELAAHLNETIKKVEGQYAWSYQSKEDLTWEVCWSLPLRRNSRRTDGG